MKIIKKIYNMLSVVVLIVLAVLMVLLLCSKFIGLQPYAVLTGSMEPEFPVGSTIYVREAGAEDIEVGDSITFYMSDSDMIVTHQVIEINEDGNYVTKGLANEAADATPVPIENVIGKVYFCIPYLGYVLSALTNPPGNFIALGIIAMWFIIDYMIDLEDKPAKRKRRRRRRRRKSKYQSSRSTNPRSTNPRSTNPRSTNSGSTNSGNDQQEMDNRS